ncbi:ArsR family transcriptional regulator [Arthrobacter sp. MYb227]|uniref:helix-turn-helix transcriptional regulator n=1 Tax=Arthrobacter sp. MYb227 TaxID=1848601 RepID=UPI000CFADAE0|nr:helix-turn-helix domain-containing protein [Arthrobacter sp. MYb227]PQZ92847.1 ArsR family transcriptional regulator [Arthrobacter sp. MYb227]
MALPTSSGQLATLESLSDPVRRGLYEFVVSQNGPVTRESAAKAVGISRSLAAYHLDKLVAAELLGFSYERPAGRSGPGAGRPAKCYARTEQEVSITVPPRSYDMLARMLAQAAAADQTGIVRSTLEATAREEGQQAADEYPDTMDALNAHGFEPVVAEDGDILMKNCPFHQVAQQQPELVCGLNHALICGYLDAKGEDSTRAELAPRPGHCCVAIHPVPGETP